MKKEEMKTYIVDAANASSDPVKFAEVRDAVKAVVAEAGGEVVKDGSGFGIKGHPEQYSHLMLVKVPADAVEKLRDIPGVEAVNENQRRTIPRPGVRGPR